MNNKNEWVSECAHCREQKRLEYARYGYAICWECEHTIAASLQMVKKAFCRICRRRYAWLWGKYEYDKGFICHGCTNGAHCQKCRNAAADKMVDSPIGPLWVCDAHAAPLTGMPQEPKVDRIY